MNKQTEIHLLQTLADSLGPDSYCGPWLRDQIPFIESDIRSDFFPTSSWSETRRKHTEIILSGREEAAEIVKTATEKAEKIVRDAETRVENTRRTLARDIQKALDAIV